MRLSQLKASELRKLTLCASAEEVVQFHGLGHFAITVEHRGFEYEVGHWLGWQGEFWAYEVRTGIIHRGTLQAVKEWIMLCSEDATQANKSE